MVGLILAVLGVGPLLLLVPVGVITWVLARDYLVLALIPVGFSALFVLVGGALVFSGGASGLAVMLGNADGAPPPPQNADGAPPPPDEGEDEAP